MHDVGYGSVADVSGDHRLVPLGAIGSPSNSLSLYLTGPKAKSFFGQLLGQKAVLQACLMSVVKTSRSTATAFLSPLETGHNPKGSLHV